MPDQQALERIHPDLGALWRHRAQVAVALYTFIALVGALYYAVLFLDFGLNPFHYWEASDFLLATFREPLSIVFGLFAVAMYFSFNHGREMNDLLFGRIGWLRRLLRYDRWRESRWMSPQLGPGMSIVLTLAWFVLVMGAVAALDADRARRGTGAAVRFALEGGRSQDAQLLTSTNRFLFLVVAGATPSEARLLAVPIDALVTLEHCGARRGGMYALFKDAPGCRDAPSAVPAPSAAPAPASAAIAAPGTAPPAASPATGATP